MTAAATLGRWTYDNEVRLLENGEAYFPAVFAAIDAARREIILETFILFEDEVGTELRSHLIDAALRGVRVAVTADGYGSPDLSDEFVSGMIDAGIDFRYFDPRPRIFGLRTNAFRRLHRKIVVVDGECAFVGGINFSEEHLTSYGPEAKQDYAVEVRGPVVQHVRRLVVSALRGEKLPRSRPWWRSRVPDMPQRVDGQRLATMLIWRDNDHHRDDIELHYRMAIRKAGREVLIANAYFFPSYRLARELRRAARRGIGVRLILQGASDHAIMTLAARSLYSYLMRAGVQIYEYCERPMHGKVAIIDDEWSTVGSSNLDPASLGLNLEANLTFFGQHFAEQLRSRIETLMHQNCTLIKPSELPPQPLWGRTLGYVIFHLMRLFPSWAQWLPRRRQIAVLAGQDRIRSHSHP